MDPGDQLYTLDQLRCWKVENLGVLDDETERSNEGGACPLTTRILLRLDFGLRPLTTKIG
jgi:hypothetical protein